MSEKRRQTKYAKRKAQGRHAIAFDVSQEEYASLKAAAERLERSVSWCVRRWAITSAADVLAYPLIGEASVGGEGA